MVEIIYLVSFLFLVFIIPLALQFIISDFANLDEINPESSFSGTIKFINTALRTSFFFLPDDMKSVMSSTIISLSYLPNIILVPYLIMILINIVILVKDIVIPW